MFKPLKVNVDQFKNTQQQPRDDTIVKDVFRALHGFYGTLFTSKFATGEADASGKDKGILSARMVWSHELQKYDRKTVSQALDSCKALHQEFPPSLPQFIALCAANAPRKVYTPAVPEIGMSQAARSVYAKRAREINLKRAHDAISQKVGYFEIQPGLGGLKSAIANAVATAGGDEGKELLRLDRLFPLKAKA